MKVSVTVHISCSTFLHCDHPSLLAVTGNGICDVRSFSAYTDSIHKLQDLQHFMFEQIDLHLFKVVINDYRYFFV